MNIYKNIFLLTSLLSAGLYASENNQELLNGYFKCGEGFLPNHYLQDFTWGNIQYDDKTGKYFVPEFIRLNQSTEPGKKTIPVVSFFNNLYIEEKGRNYPFCTINLTPQAQKSLANIINRNAIFSPQLSTGLYASENNQQLTKPSNEDKEYTCQGDFYNKLFTEGRLCYAMGNRYMRIYIDGQIVSMTEKSPDPMMETMAGAISISNFQPKFRNIPPFTITDPEAEAALILAETNPSKKNENFPQ